MKGQIYRVIPTGEQVRIAQMLTERAESLRVAAQDALLLRNQFFYKIGTLEDPPVSPTHLARLVSGITNANYMLRLLQGSNLKTDEERDGAKELSYDDPRLQ